MKKSSFIEFLSSEKAIRTVIYSTLILSVISTASILMYNLNPFDPIKKETADEFTSYFQYAYPSIKQDEIIINHHQLYQYINKYSDTDSLYFHLIQINEKLNIAFQVSSKSNPKDKYIGFFMFDSNGDTLNLSPDKIKNYKEKYLEKGGIREQLTIQGEGIEQTRYSYSKLAKVKSYCALANSKKADYLKIDFGKIFYNPSGEYNDDEKAFIDSNQNIVVTIVKAYKKRWWPLNDEIILDMLREYNKPCPKECSLYYQY